ncbi:hypothetical protein JOF56_000185 [Kibdelosporangium banguiense]|uniref:DUF2185 domain-containing protein n=1 Tax=Kibdelosporangium banguiense TaxID=1365924 RepID=A0ABS4T5R1_9PSEU|nr:hypothetical protein [Kibdelosporangium banguiense]MBP2319800.1 hypothetical protein [Kibdelosporangium banguiense]
MPTEHWPLRQDPDSPVIFARSLFEDSTRLAFAMLDDEDCWLISDGCEFSDDMAAGNAMFASVCLRDALGMVPEIQALAGLPAGMAADWDREQRTWLLSSPSESDDEEENQDIEAARLAAWKHPGSPLDEVEVSIELAEISTDPSAPRSAVRQAGRDEGGTWLFVSFDTPETEEFETTALDMDHFIALYPDVAPTLTAAPGEVWDRVSADSDWERIDDGA